MVRLNVIGAFDRYNYGDLLFPLIIKEYFKQSNYTFQFYSLNGRKFEKYGGVNTKSIFILYIKLLFVKRMNVIVSGGEVIGADWFILFSHNWRFFNWLSKKKYAYIIQYFLNKLLEVITGTKYPYVFSKFFSKRNNIVYNSVGGFGPFNLSLKEQFQFAKYISLRSSFPKKELIDFKPFLSPDSAIIMSKYFSIEKTISFDYFVFQIYLVDDSQIQFIVEQLTAFLSKNHLKLILLPIGYAFGHEDQISLMKILNSMPKEFSNRIELRKEKNIMQLMGVIKYSKFFVGTSLHGIITAMSFSVPYLCINSSKKLKNYILDWDNQNYYNNPFSIEFYKYLDLIDIINSNFEIQKSMVEFNFNRMFNFFHETK